MNLFDIVKDKNINNEELFVKAKHGDRIAEEALITNNIPLIKVYINKYKRKGSMIEKEELMSLGCVALQKAYQSYNIDSGYKFSTFFGKIIENQFGTHVRYLNREKFKKFKTSSIDQNIDNDGKGDETYHDIIAEDEIYGNFEDIVNDKMCANDILQVFYKMATTKEVEIVDKFILEQMSMIDIAEELGVTRQNVHVIYKKAIAKLKHIAMNRGKQQHEIVKIS